MTFHLGDQELSRSKALPASATSVETDGFDLGVGDNADFLVACELAIEAPALTATELPDTKTMTYIVQHAAKSDFSDAATLFDSVIVQTGDGGAVPADSARLRLPANVKRYVRVKATNSGSGDASGKSVAAALLF